MQVLHAKLFERRRSIMYPAVKKQVAQSARARLSFFNVALPPTPPPSPSPSLAIEHRSRLLNVGKRVSICCAAAPVSALLRFAAAARRGP